MNKKIYTYLGVIVFIDRYGDMYTYTWIDSQWHPSVLNLRMYLEERKFLF